MIAKKHTKKYEFGTIRKAKRYVTFRKRGKDKAKIKKIRRSKRNVFVTKGR